MTKGFASLILLHHFQYATCSHKQLFFFLIFLNSFTFKNVFFKQEAPGPHYLPK